MSLDAVAWAYHSVGRLGEATKFSERAVRLPSDAFAVAELLLRASARAKLPLLAFASARLPFCALAIARLPPEAFAVAWLFWSAMAIPTLSRPPEACAPPERVLPVAPPTPTAICFPRLVSTPTPKPP